VPFGGREPFHSPQMGDGSDACTEHVSKMMQRATPVLIDFILFSPDTTVIMVAIQ
jgi:hypothetical protein